MKTPGPLVVSITALGEVPEGTMVRRSRARAGDRICVTGTIGDAALGLLSRKAAGAAWVASMPLPLKIHLIDRYLHPQPRLAVAETLRRHASAAMDISDGLAGDLAKLLAASGVSGEVDRDAVPLSPAARAALAARPALLDRMLTGGDDYEILCTIPPDALADFTAGCAAVGVAATAIGTVTNGHELPIFDGKDGPRRYEKGSYSHF